jgi:CheY-like chemotaxis protein
MLLDLKMPGRSGFDILAWLKQSPRYRPIAVVILAGVDSMEEIRRAYRMGVNSFLTKPLVVEDLINALRGLQGVAVVLEPDGCRLQPAGQAPRAG